jgi:thiol-disulfide isomerase/thioredoxin
LSNCNQTVKTENKSNDDLSVNNIDSGKIVVIYFHNERRCATCMAVEETTQKSLTELYPEKVKNNEITFLSVNIEEETNKKLAEQYSITGQTLLIITRDSKFDLTNDAFMYAKDTPEKLTAKIKEAIETLL